MPNFIDLTGKRFGRLVVIAYAGAQQTEGRSMEVPLRLRCSRHCRMHSNFTQRPDRNPVAVYSQRTDQCPVYQTHGRSNSPEHYSWRAMKQRCCKPYATGYEYYGARGIWVCERWLNSFSAFYQDMGPRPEGCSLDRINVDGNYEPGNCPLGRRQAAKTKSPAL